MQSEVQIRLKCRFGLNVMFEPKPDTETKFYAKSK